MTPSDALDWFALAVVWALAIVPLFEIRAKQPEAYRWARAYRGAILGPLLGLAFAVYVQWVRPR